MQETSKVSRAEIEQVVLRDFPPEQFADVMAILEKIKKEPEEARLKYHLNLLKLCSGHIEILRRCIPITFEETRDQVEQQVRHDFPVEQFANVMSILDEVKKDSDDLRARFQLNILKMSHGDMALLRQHVNNSDKRTARQHVPKVTRQHVERVVRRDFPPDKFSEVTALLAAYGKESWENEIERVQLDLLKLAGGKIDALPKLLETARTDYRDIIAWAEYPNSRAHWDTHKLPDEEKKQIYEKDWKQYLDWANAK